jgi:hypothetical protein
VTVYVDRNFIEMIKIKLSHKSASNLIMSFYEEEEIPAIMLCSHEHRPCEDTMARQHSVSQEERPYKKPKLPTLSLKL